MSLSAKVDLRDVGGARQLVVHASYEAREACRTVPGSRWDKRTGAWCYPCTPAVLEALRNTFSCHLSPAVEQSFRRRSPPPKMVTVLPPWKHQIKAFQEAYDRPAWLLNMRMGTGKTKVAIDLVTNSEADQVLVLCPRIAISVWEEEYRKHGNGRFQIVALEKGSVSKRTTTAINNLNRPTIFIINYDAVWREPFAEWCLSRRWSYVIADEVHRIKAAGGMTSRFMSLLAQRADHRLGLSGTPLPHSPLDAYGVFRFLDVGIFGSSVMKFKDTYAIMGGWHNKQIAGWRNLEDFTSRFNSITTLVTDAALQLPPEIDIERKGDLDTETKMAYRQLDDDLTTEIKQGTITASNALVKLLRLQQIANGHVVTDDKTVVRFGGSKERMLFDVLSDMPAEEPVVVFGRFKEDLKIIHEVAASLDRSSAEVSGSRNELASWKDGESSVLAVQIQAGKEAISLVRACYAVYFCTGLSLGDYEQTRKRLHRPGQKRATIFIHLLMRGTVDVSTLRALRNRKQVIETIIEERQNGIR